MPAIEAIPAIAVASSESAATDPASSRFRLKWFVFRAVFVFALLQWLPLTYLLTAGALTFGAWSPPRVWGPVTNAFGHWAVTAILRLPEHSPDTYISANDLPLFLGMVVESILALGAALLWTVFKPRTSNPRLFASLYLANRYMLAGSIFYYGWGKVLLLQFAPSLDYFAFEVAQHNPRDLLWAFMAGSNSYQFFAGVVEVSAALLLLSRRTVIAGALLSLAAMGNVLALDLGYDVSVKFIALEMFLMALFAVVPYWAVLAAVLLRHVTPRADAWPRTIVLHKFSGGARIVALIVSIWLVTATLYDTVRLRATVLENRRTPLSGIWDVEQIIRDGTDVPLVVTNPELWRRFVFQSKNAAVVFPMNNYPLPRAGNGRANAIRYEMRLDETTHSVRLTPFPMSGTDDALIFNYRVVDAGHLELTTADSRVAVRLRRFDVSAYPLVSWERRWSW